jgi:hypothetical protein
MAIAPWIVTCTCGWIVTAFSLEDACQLVHGHQQSAESERRHFVTIKGLLPDRQVPRE